jgi:hypothetical protein
MYMSVYNTVRTVSALSMFICLHMFMGRTKVWTLTNGSKYFEAN